MSFVLFGSWYAEPDPIIIYFFSPGSTQPWSTYLSDVHMTFSLNFTAQPYNVYRFVHNFMHHLNVYKLIWSYSELTLVKFHYLFMAKLYYFCALMFIVYRYSFWCVYFGTKYFNRRVFGHYLFAFNHLSILINWF